MKKFRTQFDRRNVKKSFLGVKSMTDPQYADECTIEGIIRRYGVLPRPDVKPIDIDVSEFQDFETCLARVTRAMESFHSLPSDIRQRFGGDPKSYYEFITNPENLQEMVRLGLAEVKSQDPTERELLGEISETIKKGVSSKEPTKAQ